MGWRGRLGALVVAACALAAISAPLARAQAPPDRRAEASALARIAMDTRAELRTRAPLVAAAVKRLDRFTARCPALERAGGRAPENELNALSVALTTRFFYGPIRGTLDRFAGELEAVAATDSVLRGGVVGWRKAVGDVQAYGRLPDRVCSAVRRWERSGYAPARAPVDPTAVVALDDRSERHSDAIERASRRLLKLGATKKAAEAFTVDGLLQAAFPDEVSESEAGSSDSARARRLG